MPEIDSLEQKDSEGVVLVHVDFPHRQDQEDLPEFRELAASTGAKVADEVVAARRVPDAKYFIGSGKVDEIQQSVLATGASLVLFNHELSPAQERNLERALQCRVLDRTGLILDIFSQRARSAEGKLQVELAQLEHLSTRLVRGWTHLERQKGGIGLRGPGETQLETDRRLLRARIKSINKRLQKVHKQRNQSRRARQRAALPTLSLVGYTNTGKTTLFNWLTGDSGYVADQLFATLDPTLRRIELPGAGGAIVADTVGFIRHLPHQLVEAFKATLEETQQADLLLHVIDASCDDWQDKMAEVNTVLEEIGAQDVPQIEVYNKIDLLAEAAPQIERDRDGKPSKVWISAAKAWGMAELLQAVSEALYGDPVYRKVYLTAKEAKLRARLYQLGAVLKEVIDDEGHWVLDIKLAKDDFRRFFS